MATQNVTRKVYNTVVEDVIANVREAFLDEGVDEQILQELKHLWETKLSQSRALEPLVSETDILQGGNIPYIMQAQPTHAQAQGSQQGTALQQQIPIPVQIGPDGQLSSAATMAFNAQGGVFQQHLQALVNVPSGGQFTVQQASNGQYILQAVPQTIGVPHTQTQTQVMTLPQQNLIQTQNPQIQQTHPGIPQLDGTHDQDLSPDTTAQAPAPSGCPDSPQPSTSKSEEPSCQSSSCSRLEPGIIIEGECSKIPQLDGGHDTSSSEEDNYDENDNDDDDDDDEKDHEDGGGEEEEPLNSGDDVSEEDPTELFDTENVVVCQFEKISRNKSKWKFTLKDGIMNLNGRDHVFQKGLGEADW